MSKKEQRLSSDEDDASIATEASDDELSLADAGSFVIEAGAAAGSRSWRKQGASIASGDRRKRISLAVTGLAIVALVVGLSVGIAKGRQGTPGGTPSSADGKDIAQQDKKKPKSPTARPTLKPTNAVFYTAGGFECTEHASCRCYDEEVCQDRKGVYSTHTLEYDACEKKCLAEEDCNG